MPPPKRPKYPTDSRIRHLRQDIEVPINAFWQASERDGPPVQTQRKREGAVQTGGIFAVVASTLYFLDKVFPEFCHWHELGLVIGTFIAYFGGSWTAGWQHRRKKK